MEKDGIWLPIIDYSKSTGISISTIRRRIKSGKITFRMTDGKYYILSDEQNGGLENEYEAEILRLQKINNKLSQEIYYFRNEIQELFFAKAKFMFLILKR